MRINQRLKTLEAKQGAGVEQAMRQLKSIPREEHSDFYRTLSSPVLEGIVTKLTGIPRKDLTPEILRGLIREASG